MNPGANQVFAERSTIAGVPASETYSARSWQASVVPNFGDEHTMAIRVKTSPWRAARRWATAPDREAPARNTSRPVSPWVGVARAAPAVAESSKHHCPDEGAQP